MVVTKSLPPASARSRVAPPPASSDGLQKLLGSIQPAPPRVPQHLWDAALARPVAEFLSRPGKRFRARLVELAWRAAGRDDAPAAVLPLFVELLHAGSLIVDDIEDDSLQRRGQSALHRLIGLPLALNAGNWLYFWPLSLLRTAGLTAEAELALHHRAIDAVRRCHEGQALDLSACIGDLHPSEVRDVAQTISEWKTGSLMSLAAAAGAIAAGAGEGAVEALATFGERLGVGLQMQNDLSELTGAAGPLKHPEDLVHGRVTWPWAWAAERLPAARFDLLQSRAARLMEGTGDATAVSRGLLEALGDDRGIAVREWLAEAFADLEKSFPGESVLDDFEAELHRLEVEYA